MDDVLLVRLIELDSDDIVARPYIDDSTSRSGQQAPLRLIDHQLHFVVLIHNPVLSRGAGNAVMSRGRSDPTSCHHSVRIRREPAFGPSSIPSTLDTAAPIP